MQELAQFVTTFACDGTFLGTHWLTADHSH